MKGRLQIFIDGLAMGILALSLLPCAEGVIKYKTGDHVTLYVNKVGPYHNPQETYHYYTLPVCRPKEVSGQRAAA